MTGEKTAMPPVPHRRTTGLDRAAIRADMGQARLDFHGLTGHASRADKRRPSDGTRWTNRQLLFHMVLGYMVVRALLVLVRLSGPLPDSASNAFARLLDSARTPFDLVNYPGSCAGARLIPARCLTRVLGRTIAALQRHLQRETGTTLSRGMHYPATWDPFFAGYMTLAASTATPPSTSASTSASSHSARHAHSRASPASPCR